MEIDSGKISFHNYTINFAGGSDIGFLRTHNEDCIAIIPESYFFCLADGVGGLDAGEVASEKVISYLKSHFSTQCKKKKYSVKRILRSFFTQKQSSLTKMSRIISDANNELCYLARSLNKNMATTIVALQLLKNRAIICNVGDSRIYLLRNNIIGQLTIDHTLSMSLLLSAGTNFNHNHSGINQHTITRALGAQQDIEPDKQILNIYKADLFLLCSDGLTDMIDDEKICEIVEENTNNISNVVQELIKEANVAGGKDNISVIAVNIQT